MFCISVTEEESIVCVAPEGRLDTLHSESFNEKLQFLLEKEMDLIIDGSLCNYLSSSGIRSILSATKKVSAKGGNLILCSLTPEVFQVLEMAGLNAFFHIVRDKKSAIAEILRLKKISGKFFEVQTDDFRFQIEPLNAPAGDERTKPLHQLFYWKNKDMAGYNELGISAGIGSPAECIAEEEENTGLFITIGKCSGFIPRNTSLYPEFRVMKDPSGGGVYLHQALSFRGDPADKIRLISSGGIRLDEWIDQMVQLAEDLKTTSPESSVNTVRICSPSETLRGFLLADFDATEPSVSLLWILDQDESEDLGSRPFSELLQFVQTTCHHNKVLGARFILNQNTVLSGEDSFSDFTHQALTLQNIERVEPLKLSFPLSAPIAWCFYAGPPIDANALRIKVEVPDHFILEPYKAFLIRRLYNDSAHVALKPLQGGFSAQTFQVDSYDPQGRKLRPTVLKIAHRDMIMRESDRCIRYAMPYIMNNSAMVLGTALFCDMGALRYNFVGIEGPQTQLQWLTHYFNTWTVEQLKPLFDNIFLEILKPWYGQPVKENIYPYKNQDPTLSFFPRLCETAETTFSISADDPAIKIDENSQEQVNPYWFLKHKYPERRNQAINYYTSICHGDLNMQNILLDQKRNVYLIDFSETGPRSVISDFARLEAIFMIEHFPLDSRDQLNDLKDFTSHFYNKPRLDKIPDTRWNGETNDSIQRNLALIQKMREYAIASVSGDSNIVPYYLALLEWVLPVVCYSSASMPQKKLSAHIAGILCKKILEYDLA